MSAAVRPWAGRQRRIVGTARLAEIGTEVELLAKATDLATGREFYIVNSGWPFGVWPEELVDIKWAMPIKEGANASASA